MKDSDRYYLNSKIYISIQEIKKPSVVYIKAGGQELHETAEIKQVSGALRKLYCMVAENRGDSLIHDIVVP